MISSAAVQNTRAIITTKWGNKSYSPKTVRSIQSYYIDTAMDNDADPWQIEIADVDADYVDVLRRDAEVRMQIFGAAPKATGVEFLTTGIADEISYDEQGIIRFQGRDMSALAVDSTVPATHWRAVRAWAVVAQQAREIGMKGRLDLAKLGAVKKTVYTDGSETYWELWHRLYRKEKGWIWTGPRGQLHAGHLNYNQHPTYYFGDPKAGDPKNIREKHIPVISFNVRKSTTGRIGFVEVYGHRGDNGFLVKTEDPQTRHWIKRPRRIIQDSDAASRKAALRTAWEEIFEGKVGELEFTVTIPDPGYTIRPNTIARLRITDRGITGEFFVVGVRVQAGLDGLLQEVRLREKQFALSRRVPTDPKPGSAEPSPETASGLGPTLQGAVGGMPGSWGNFFVKAAREFNGPWDFSLFLATLLAMSDQESGFQNIREHAGPGEEAQWYPWMPANTTTYPIRDSQGRTEAQWRQIFANENPDWGVGPMQLTSITYKQWADDYYRQGYHDQYEGGRWHPQYNIFAAARALRNSLKEIVHDSGRDIDMWMGVMAYNRGVQGARDYFNSNGRLSDYAQSVKAKVYNNPGYLKEVQDAIQNAKEAAQAAKEGQTDVDPVTSASSITLPNRAQCLAIVRAVSDFSNEIEKRQAIVATAMFGYYNAGLINYTQTAQRTMDFGPPPNVPASTDCSGFVAWCYKSAHAPSASGSEYPTTYSQRRHGRVIRYTQILPGDLIFYENPDHVSIYVGSGKCVSHGSAGAPYLLGARYRPIVEIRSYL